MPPGSERRCRVNIPLVHAPQPDRRHLRFQARCTSERQTDAAAGIFCCAPRASHHRSKRFSSVPSASSLRIGRPQVMPVFSKDNGAAFTAIWALLAMMLAIVRMEAMQEPANMGEVSETRRRYPLASF